MSGRAVETVGEDPEAALVVYRLVGVGPRRGARGGLVHTVLGLHHQGRHQDHPQGQPPHARGAEQRLEEVEPELRQGVGQQGAPRDLADRRTRRGHQPARVPEAERHPVEEGGFQVGPPDPDRAQVLPLEQAEHAAHLQRQLLDLPQQRQSQTRLLGHPHDRQAELQCERLNRLPLLEQKRGRPVQQQDGHLEVGADFARALHQQAAL